VQATSGPEGSAVSGSVELLDASGRGGNVVQGPVTCLSVTGNVAIVGYTGRLSDLADPFTGRQTGFVRVTDRGGPDSGQDTWELGGQRFEEDPFEGPRPPLLPGPTDCAAFTGPWSPPLVNHEGDLTVVDAQALPTSKDDCKNGGWRQYGTTFKNQGQCVAFVQRGPKP
jgi:hypothetical protein